MTKAAEFTPSEGEIAERGFDKTYQSEIITRWTKRRPCPGGYEELCIEVTAHGAVFFTRIASRSEELWKGHPLPSREFYEQLFEAFGW